MRAAAAAHPRALPARRAPTNPGRARGDPRERAARGTAAAVALARLRRGAGLPRLLARSAVQADRRPRDPLPQEARRAGPALPPRRARPLAGAGVPGHWMCRLGRAMVADDL